MCVRTTSRPIYPVVLCTNLEKGKKDLAPSTVPWYMVGATVTISLRALPQASELPVCHNLLAQAFTVECFSALQIVVCRILCKMYFELKGK